METSPKTTHFLTPAAPELPEIVRIVLIQAARHRMHGLITQEVFDAQLRRLAREELHPHGLSLSVRDLSSGQTRFVITVRGSERVCDVVDVLPGENLETAADPTNDYLTACSG